MQPDRTCPPARARARTGVVALVAVLALVAGCSSSSSPAGAPPPAAKIVPGGTVVVAVDAEPSGFNNRTAKGNTTVVRNVMRRVWPSVFTITPDFQTQLDTDFVVSAQSTGIDPQTIVYQINPRATWYDGTPISAADFVYNWEAGSGATDVDGKPISSVAPGEEAIKSVTGSPDGKTVTVTLKQPTAEWKALFTKPLVPAHVGKRVGWNSGFDDPAAVISGGPFKIQSYNAGRDLTLVRNERYWGTPATLDSVIFSFLKDSSTTMTALVGGDVQVIAPRAQVDLVQQLRSYPNVTTLVGTGFEAEFLDFNLKNELLADVNVRKAFALALDRQAIVDRTVGQIDKSTRVMENRLLAFGDPGWADTGGRSYDTRTPQNLAEAKRLLEGAGFALNADRIYARAGKPLALKITAATGDALRDAQEELIVSQVRDAGIKLEVANAPNDNSPDSLSNRLRRGDFDVADLSQGMAVYPTTTSASFASTGSVNISKYSNPVVDDLYAQARTELDDAKRAALLNRIDAQLWQDLPRLPLYQRPTVVAFCSALANVEVNPVSGPLWNIDKWGYTGSCPHR